jgi:signal transduction histidine kinase
VKYAAAGGWVSVRAEAASHRDGPRLSIAVEDRGPGISPDDLPNIFDPFYRGEAVRNSQIPGVGLGLSLVRRIIEAHHGSIEVKSADVKSSEHGGAVFILYLPALPVEVATETQMKEVAS